jgi:hypothetical protein
MESTPQPDNLVEIFHTNDLAAAQEIVVVVLQPEGIEAVVHDRKDMAFPASGQPGGFYIAVPGTQREKAIGLIDEARENGFLDDKEGDKVEP